MLIGIIFLGVVIYIVICLKQQNDYQREKQKQYEIYHPRKMRAEDYRREELERKMIEEEIQSNIDFPRMG